MPNGFGGGRGVGFGFRGGMGFGFRGNSPPWPYVGLGRGGLPRCGYFLSDAGAPRPWPYQTSPSPFYSGMAAASGYGPYSPQMSREEELNYLKDQAEAIKGQLEQIETKVRDLESEK